MDVELRAATVGLMDGGEVSGRLRAFEPAAPEIELAAEANGDGPMARRLPAGAVAWVGLARGPGSVPPERSERDAPPLRVHLPGGRSLVVAPEGDPHDLLGFWGTPLDYESRFERVYFFAHGRKALEREQRLGEMLVVEGALAVQDLARGLDRQAALRRQRIGEILLEQKRIEAPALDRGLELHRRRGARLGDVLIEAGLASRDDIEAALREQSLHRGRRIGEILVEMGVVSERALAETLARKFHLPFVDLDRCLIDPAAMSAVPQAIVQQHNVLPLEIDGGQLTVALADPLNTRAIDLIRFHRAGPVREVVAMPSQIERYVRRALGEAEEAELDAGLAELGLEAAASGVEDDADDAHVSQESDNAVIQLVNQILLEAVRRGASDVHVEPNGPNAPVRVRFRVDGECQSMPGVPASLRKALVSRLKIMARLDIAERRKPQDGKIRFRLPERMLELRVATLPTVGGEDVVLRLLSGSKPYPIHQLALSERNRRELERLVHQPYGLVLCVGPTGSGKSTTLHALLGLINGADRKIWTAEDPVEITQAGLRQVQVQPKIGFGFAEAMRAFLRADPDVIMIGEMRDREAAAIAIEASLTGHLVLSTLHTNSASETVVRLVEMGLDPFSFGDALLGVLAQRLVRRLCEGCRSLEPASEADRETLAAALGDERDALGQLVWRGRGCETCRGTGYRGRVAIHELLVVDDALRLAIHGRASADRIREQALAGGMKTLLEDGARKCLDGSTDLKEVLGACIR